ncbi:MAG: glycosyltransferase family protein [Deferribacteraceae bacterium]|jgi:spore coat polysaccharide biosynthesis protein SpsF|nr:glycosyltransferase family protein [Deferribacteraceae bacterium]
MGKATVIIQARMGSTRLPGKIFMPLPFGGEATVLQQVCRRVSESPAVEQIVIATTENHTDAVVAEWAENNNYFCFRGSQDDVLDRYYHAAVRFGADPVIRITSDCPCIDSSVISDMIRAYPKSGADYLSNSIERTFPHGLDTEIFSFAALEQAWEAAVLQPHREHVTPYIYRSGFFNCKSYTNEEAAPEDAKIRVTLDTREDYILLCAVYGLLGETFSGKDLVKLFKTHNWLRMINENIMQKKTYDSIKDEITDAVKLLQMQDMPNAVTVLKNSL